MSAAPIEGIKPLWNTMPLMQSTQESRPGGAEIPFADIFQSAIETVKQTSAEQADLQYRLAVGDLDNPAELSIAASKAAASVDLLVQLRNKSLDAYSELMRISL